MTLESSIPSAAVHETAYDFAGLTDGVNDGRTLHAEAILYDDSGRAVHVDCSYSRGASRVTFRPTAGVPVSAVEWLEAHGGYDVLLEAQEAMAVHRDWLADKDTMNEARMIFVVRQGGAS